MFLPHYTAQFKKDAHKLERSGSHDIEKLKTIVRKLLNGEPLDTRHRDHPLTGNWKGHRDCHVGPDWILIYRIDMEAQVITFIRTGSHADIFG